MKLPPKEDIFLQSIENDFNFFNEYYKNNYKKSEEEFRKYINNLSKDCKLFNSGKCSRCYQIGDD